MSAGDVFDSQDFYELMQAYRLVPVTDQPAVVRAFEDVKIFCRKGVRVLAKKKQAKTKKKQPKPQQQNW